MRKTTVYLTDEEVAALHRTAARTGRSKSELIREGVRRVTRGDRDRRFRSMGSGEGTGESIAGREEELLGELLWQDHIEQRRFTGDPNTG